MHGHIIHNHSKLHLLQFAQLEFYSFVILICTKRNLLLLYSSMASLTRNLGLAFLCVVFGFVCFSNAQLSSNYYGVSCPNLQTIVSNAVRQAVNREARLGASILRLFFHDCFVNVSSSFCISIISITVSYFDVCCNMLSELIMNKYI